MLVIPCGATKRVGYRRGDVPSLSKSHRDSFHFKNYVTWTTQLLRFCTLFKEIIQPTSGIIIRLIWQVKFNVKLFFFFFPSSFSYVSIRKIIFFGVRS